MILVFDLDDTLYDETTFVKSGFRSVAQFLSENYSLSEKEIYQALLTEFEKGRGSIFDEVLLKNHIFSKKLVRKCISVYRLHAPDIKLYAEAKQCLKRFKDYPIYIVTDGNKVVQYNKIKALGLDKIVKFYFITYRYGRHHSKPSPYCFQKIASLEKTNASDIVYIGDNVTKDFVGIKPLGFRTIQAMTGQYAHIQKPASYQAETKINSLNELTEKYIIDFFKKK